MIRCLDTGRTFGETAAEEAHVRYGVNTGAAAKAVLSRDAGFEWAPSLAFLHERHLRDRALLVYPPAPTSAERGVAEALDSSRAEAVEIVDLEDAGGYGVFAVEPIATGALVVEYAGLVAPATDGFDSYGLSYAETLAGESLRLSARRFGNAARFVNHAPADWLDHDHAAPNAELVRVVHHGLLRVCVVAVTRIAPGDQILVDYGDAYWRASGVRPRALPRCLADIGPADWNPLDDLVSEPDLRGFAEWYASEADNETESRWFPRDAGTPGLRRRVVLLWLRRCQRWIKNELYHGASLPAIPWPASDKAARLRTLARRVDLYCIAWRGDVETSIRMNEAHAVAARAMLGLPPAVVAATPAADVTDEIASLSL